MSKKIEQEVANLIKEPVEALGYELVDVTFRRQHGDMHLTVYIYHKDGITLDDCERVSNLIDPLLDQLNPTGDQPYMLDVSSPGLDRPIKTADDFRRNTCKEVEVKLYAPIDKRKVIEAELLGYDGKKVFLRDLKTGQQIDIEQEKISLIRQLVKFD